MPAVPREQFRFSRLGWIWMFVEVFRTRSLWPGPTSVAGAVLLTTCSLSFPGHRCRAGRVCNLSLSTTICHTSGGKCCCRQVSQLRPPLCMTNTPQLFLLRLATCVSRPCRGPRTTPTDTDATLGSGRKAACSSRFMVTPGRL